MQFERLRSRASVSRTGSILHVGFTHWLIRSKGYDVHLDRVEEIRAVQIEPFTMQLAFKTDGTSQRLLVSEEMDGYSEVLAYAQDYFAGFDSARYETAKCDVGLEVVCWSKPGPESWPQESEGRG